MGLKKFGLDRCLIDLAADMEFDQLFCYGGYTGLISSHFADQCTYCGDQYSQF